MTHGQAKELGRLISRARKAKGLSLRDLEELTDIPHPWLARVEWGDYAAPSAERLAQLAEVLDIDAARLNRLSRGHLRSGLPAMRTYLRSKYDLSPEAIASVERAVERIKAEDERRGVDERRAKPSSGRHSGAQPPR